MLSSINSSLLAQRYAAGPNRRGVTRVGFHGWRDFGVKSDDTVARLRRLAIIRCVDHVACQCRSDPTHLAGVLVYGPPDNAGQSTLASANPWTVAVCHCRSKMSPLEMGEINTTLFIS